MFKDLLFKKVKCSDLGVLAIMYPNFRFIHHFEGTNNLEFESCNIPFIFCGPISEIQSINSMTVPYIIVSPTSEYDLDDRNILIDLACKKHHVCRPSNTEYLNFISWDEFIYTWKIFWVTGILQYKEYEYVDLFQKIVDNLEYRYVILLYYLMNYEYVKDLRFQDALSKFIYKCKRHDNNVLPKTLTHMNKFLELYSCNVENAIMNYLDTPIDSCALITLNFILDLFGICKRK